MRSRSSAKVKNEIKNSRFYKFCYLSCRKSIYESLLYIICINVRYRLRSNWPKNACLTFDLDSWPWPFLSKYLVFRDTQRQVIARCYLHALDTVLLSVYDCRLFRWYLTFLSDLDLDIHNFNIKCSKIFTYIHNITTVYRFCKR